LSNFTLDFDFNTEGYNSIWEAHAYIVEIAHIEQTDIISATLKDKAINGFFVLSIVFSSKETAEAYTYAYLGNDPNDFGPYDNYTKEQIVEFISFGKFTN